jgi:hypothetical protein
MRDVVIVPTYERPEYAWVCLEYLSRARGIEDKEVWLCQDNHEDGFVVDPMDAPEDSRKLALFFGQTFKNRACWYCATPHNTYGNSQNLVNSMCRAYESGAERIFLIEDDIMVAPDIFEWHEEVLRFVNPLVSCATAINKSAHFPINGRYSVDESIQDPEAYHRSATAYSSHASAFTRENLGLLLLRIESQLEWGEWRQGMEQDLLIQKIMESFSFENCGSAWPYVPRAFNVGMYSYHINSAMKFNGTLDEKVSALRSAIVNPEKLRYMSADNQAITPVPAVFEERHTPKLHELKRYR